MFFQISQESELPKARCAPPFRVFSYLIFWHVSLSGPAYHSHFCWLRFSSLGLSLENSKEECSTSFQARSKILTRSVCCSQTESLTLERWLQSAVRFWMGYTPQISSLHLSTPGLYFWPFPERVLFENPPWCQTQDVYDGTAILSL